MRVQLCFFASHRDVTGVGEVELTVPEACTVEQLSKILADRFPGLEPLLPFARPAVNETYVLRGARLEDGDRVVFIPPVSGG